MKVLVTGGTGFIGSALCAALVQLGYQLTILTRGIAADRESVRFIRAIDELTPTDIFDAVINLAGEPIADKRWSAARKQKIIDSRLSVTQTLVDYMQQAVQTPKVFISGSAIGYYGVGSGNQLIDESAASDETFSSVLCQKWEAAAQPATDLGVRTCLLRTGIVLGDGGALSKMLLPFKFGLGGKIGSGQQWMPWIHIEDMVAIILRCLQDANLSGGINAVAPTPVVNAEFTKALGRALNRPTIVPMPGFAIQMLMGEMGEELLLAGKKVVPTKLLATDFTFRYSKIGAALEDVVG